ncbi:hypothetical protein scyTo_0006035 [Scyliorhinus torazame]|uniref:Uncharacterized protein n=1 Tax=Scyliorhinus torazame TaxID=75743 RepID=A0A401PEZ5_SCYTO|nr:hypothetical protein [Scyliorhinus torazame]
MLKKLLAVLFFHNCSVLIICVLWQANMKNVEKLVTISQSKSNESCSQKLTKSEKLNNLENDDEPDINTEYTGKDYYCNQKSTDPMLDKLFSFLPTYQMPVQIQLHLLKFCCFVFKLKAIGLIKDNDKFGHCFLRIYDAHTT